MNCRSKYLPFLGFIFGLITLTAGPAGSAIHTIDVSNFSFTPAKTLVAAGDTVRWVLISGTHTTTSDASSPKFWDSGVIPSGGHFDVVFTAGDGPGPFPYHCAIHSTIMKDTIFMAPPAIICGDANGDETVNVGDAVFLINYIFREGPAPDPVCIGNVNGDADVNVGDAVYLINFVFKSGPPPSESCCLQ